MGSSGRANPSTNVAARSSSASGMRLSGCAVACRLATTSVAASRRIRTTWQTRRSLPHFSRSRNGSASACAWARRNLNGLSTRRRCSTTASSRARSTAFAWPVTSERKRRASRSASAEPRPPGSGSGRRPTSASAVIALHSCRWTSDGTDSSCRQTTSGRSATASRTNSSLYAFRPRGFVLPWKRFQVRTSRRSTVLRMHVALADPPAFTPAYDHELASALVRAGADVELVTSRFRFGATPAPAGYRRSDVFYPLSSRLFRRSRLRLPVKALEHAPGMVALLRRRPDVLHLQWLAAPELDRFLLRTRVPSVFTAHDLLPRRTARRLTLWRTLLSRFDRVVVHSEQGREVLTNLGVDATVIPHPVFPSDPPRADDGRTLLSIGTIRPYKGLGDAIAAARRIDGARLLVAGDPLEPLNGYREQGGDTVEWRPGYLPQHELERALGDATVALFPYRPELDQSGALLQALGAGVPAVAYDVGGIAEPVRRLGAGRVGPAGDVEALTTATRELLDDPSALEQARAGARRAREELTWDASAAAHLDLYRELA